MIKKLFIALCICIGAIPAVSAQSDLMNVHREWVKEHYGNPGQMSDSDLVTACLDIIGSNLREPEADLILETVSKKTDGLKNYIKWRKSGKPDKLYKNTIEALEAVCRFAEKADLPAVEKGYAKSILLTIKGNVSDVQEEWEKARSGYLSEIGRPTTSAEAGLPVLMKAISKMQEIVRRGYDNPDEYGDIFEIEKEALAVYPAKSNHKDRIKAELYFWLGELKANLQSDYAAGLEQSLADFNKDTSFVMIGRDSRYPCNAGFYYQKAAETGRKVLNAGHPYVNEINRALNCFTAYNMNSSPSHWANVKNNLDYILEYYPEKSPEAATARILWYIICSQNAMPLEDEAKLREAADILDTTLGKANPIYFQHIFQLAITMLFADADNAYWNKQLDSIMTAKGHSMDDDPDDMDLYTMTLLTYQQHSLDPEDTIEKMGVVLEEYMDSHSPTLLSVLTGRILADYYYNMAFNISLAQDIIFTALLDCEHYNHNKFTGEKGEIEAINIIEASKNSPLFWEINQVAYNNLDLRNYQMLKDGTESMNYLIENMDFRGKPFVKHTFRSVMAANKVNFGKDYAAAVELLEQAVPGPDTNMDEAKVEDLSFLAVYMQKAGKNRDKSRAKMYEAQQIIDNSLNTAILPINFNTIGLWYENDGDLEKAVRWYEKAVEQYKKLYGEDAFSNEYLSLRKDLASILEKVGRYSESRRILGEDADFMAQSFGVVPTPSLIDDLWLAYYSIKSDNVKDGNMLMSRLYTLNDLTERLFQNSGNNTLYLYSYGLRLISESIAFFSSFWDKDEYEAATGDNRARMDQNLEQMKQRVGVVESLLESGAVTVPNFEEDSDRKNAIQVLSQYYDKIENNIEKVLELEKQLIGKEITEDNLSYNIDYAWTLISLDRKDEAGIILDKVVDLYNKGMLKSISDFDLMSVYYFKFRRAIENNNMGEAYSFAYLLYTQRRNFLDTNFKLMTSTEQENYMQSYGDPAAFFTVLVEYDPCASSSAYDAVLHRTGLQLRSQRELMNIIKNSDNPKYRNMLDSIERYKMEIQSFTAFEPGLSLEQTKQRNFELAEIRHKMNRTEQKLLAELDSQREKSVQDVTWKDVKNTLRKGECAIEFIFSDTGVMALLLGPESTGPLPVMLCPVDSLSEVLYGNDMKNSAARARILYGEKAGELYSILWEPLEPYLKDVKTVYYTLPGVLSNLAFNAFTAPDGERLFDKYDLVQLTTTGQLVFDYPESRPETIAMMGDILYDESQKPVSPDAPGARDIDMDFTFEFAKDEDEDEGDRALKRTHFRHLPFTALEIDDIAEQFAGAGAEVDSVRRLNATEPRLRQMVEEHPDVLHLATHGYYISPDKDVSAFPFLKTKGSGNMQRSGIALAGAEKTWTGKGDAPDESDGILTAAEVALLDLKGTGLVALSACETALGDFSFEGVYGLQRGFKQAGVRSLLVSLWSVNDRSTSLFMTEFYKKLRAGDSRYDSWREAVEKVRSQYPDPYYWAPFILLDAKRPEKL